MNGKTAVEKPFIHGDVIIIPVFRSRTTVFQSGGAGEKEPLGLLIHTGSTLRIVSFSGSYSWWDDLKDTYPVLRMAEPFISAAPPE